MIDVIKETLTERASLSYWVSFANEHNNNEVEYNFYTSAFPIEFNNISPFVARISAISFVRLNPVVPTSDGKLQLRVYLMDNESGKNYLYTEELSRLQMSCRI